MIETLLAKIVFWTGAFFLLCANLGMMHYKERLDYEGNLNVSSLGFLGFVRKLNNVRFPSRVRVYPRSIFSIVINYCLMVFGLWLLFHLVEFRLYITFIIGAMAIRVLVGIIVERNLVRSIKIMITRIGNVCVWWLILWMTFSQIALSAIFYWLLVFLN